MRKYSDIQVTMTCHEVLRSLEDMLGHVTPKHWEKLSEAQQEASLKETRLLLDIMKAGCPKDPAVIHEIWCQLLWDSGWTQGPKNNPLAKPPTHPDLVPWKQLPPTTQARKCISYTILKTMSEAQEELLS